MDIFCCFYLFFSLCLRFGLEFVFPPLWLYLWFGIYFVFLFWSLCFNPSPLKKKKSLSLVF